MRLLLMLSLLSPFLVQGQTVCSAESRTQLETMMQELATLDTEDWSMAQLTLEIGKRFLNTPYVEKTLEVAGEEQLVVNLMGLDCTTYLESIVTLARITRQQDFTFAAYARELEFLRYREGKRTDYPSRLHYFSDWIYENEQKGVLQDITAEIGGKPYENPLGFMSAHPQYYAQLSNPAFVAAMKAHEAKVRARDYHYIPKSLVAKQESLIQSGDLIAITISMKDLDISHVGMAVEKDGRIHLLHASSAAKKVVISSVPLSDYLMKNKSQSGIMVCRLQEMN